MKAYPVLECELWEIFTFGALCGVCFVMSAALHLDANAVGSGVCFVLALVAACCAIWEILGIKRDTEFDDVDEW